MNRSSRRGRALPATALLALGVAAPGGAEPPVDAGPRHVDAMPLGPSVAERVRAIQQRIQSGASYPPSAVERGAEGETIVAFRITPEGRASEIEVTRSSGSLALDRAASRAVREAESLPALSGRIQVPVIFRLRDPGAGGAAAAPAAEVPLSVD